MRRKVLPSELINLWMVKCFGYTIEEAYEKEPWDDQRDFHMKHKVSKKQYDEWVIEAKKFIKETTKYPNRILEREWPYIDLQTGPTHYD